MNFKQISTIQITIGNDLNPWDKKSFKGGLKVIIVNAVLGLNETT